MKIEEVIDIIKKEKQCVQIVSSNICDRNCEKCDLGTDNEKLLEAYDDIIKFLSAFSDTVFDCCSIYGQEILVLKKKNGEKFNIKEN